jgi:hypothetical protein
MAEHAGHHQPRFWNRWRVAGWGAAAAVLLLPLVAMQFTDEVAWDAADFALAGALVVGAGLLYELAARMTARRAYRTAIGLALAAAVFLVWLDAAVGIVGNN